jgi:hypothetical protein
MPSVVELTLHHLAARCDIDTYTSEPVLSPESHFIPIEWNRIRGQTVHTIFLFKFCASNIFEVADSHSRSVVDLQISVWLFAVPKG